jgi:hypothetical protein
VLGARHPDLEFFDRQGPGGKVLPTTLQQLVPLSNVYDAIIVM